MVGKARPKLTALLRCKNHYSLVEMVQQFKTHILNLLETAIRARYHAADSVRKPLDDVMASFLKHTGLDARTAFIKHNLAPTQLRRDIAMLGVLFKCMRKEADPALLHLFPGAPETQTHREQSTRLQEARHDRQLLDRCTGKRLEIMDHSLFGLVRIFNLLPQKCMDAKTTCSFQKRVTELARAACTLHNDELVWSTLFSPRVPSWKGLNYGRLQRHAEAHPAPKHRPAKKIMKKNKEKTQEDGEQAEIL